MMFKCSILWHLLPCHFMIWVWIWLGEKTKLWLQIVAYMHMPLLFVPDCYSRACIRIGEGSTACHGVVHLSDPLLTYTLTFYLPSKTSIFYCSLMVPFVLSVFEVSGVGCLLFIISLSCLLFVCVWPMGISAEFIIAVFFMKFGCTKYIFVF